MELILGSLEALQGFGLPGLVVIVLAAVIWKMFSILENKDASLKETITSFEETVKEEAKMNRKSRREDNEKVTTAVNHVADLVKHINRMP